jgi:asparagine synthase (glutamine-hydrolysing)
VTDARIDGCAELRRELTAAGRHNLDDITDAELILHAYHAWGIDCLQRLIGDFAFAIWDEANQRLFCARDHFGVKPLYYSRIGSTLVFSSDVDSLRQHPGVSSAMDETAVGDFLIFSYRQDENATIYRDIRRLPPAHRLLADHDGIRIERYWDIPTDGCIRYANEADYPAHYRELFTAAVEDRLRSDRVTLALSGGTDSTAVAAIAARQHCGDIDFQAFSKVYDGRLLPDPKNHTERDAAQQTADSAGIPVKYLILDDYRLYERGSQAFRCWQQPTDNPTAAVMADFNQLCAGHSRVTLTGLGGDAVLAGFRAYKFNLLRQGRLKEFGSITTAHLNRYRTLRGMGLRSGLKQLFGARTQWRTAFPAWIRPEFARKVSLHDRWDYYTRALTPRHPTHADAYDLLKDACWSAIFADRHSTPDAAGPSENRHPFFDVRVVSFVLSIPPIPWCERKNIHRDAMSGILPERVRTRPKFVEIGDSYLERLRRDGLPEIDFSSVGESVDREIHRSALEHYRREGVLEPYAAIWAPMSLACWLMSRSR